tara:strand:- start:297 stop:437 length:141 start_codon:yes stop_codon:yes gene_type:complete
LFEAKCRGKKIFEEKKALEKEHESFLTKTQKQKRHGRQKIHQEEEG